MTTGYLYVPNEDDNTISVVDISNDSVVATIPSLLLQTAWPSALTGLSFMWPVRVGSSRS